MLHTEHKEFRNAQVGHGTKIFENAGQICLSI